MARVHVLKRGLAVGGERMVGVLIKGVGEPLVASVVSVGRDQHEDASLVGDLEALLPAVGGEEDVKVLGMVMYTTMTSKAWVRLW